MSKSQAGYLILTNQDLIEIDQTGVITGRISANFTALNTYWAKALEKQMQGSGRRYFWMIKSRLSAPNTNYSISAYYPGVGYQNETVFSDQIQPTGKASPIVLDLTDSTCVIIGQDFYKKIKYSATEGFVEEWSRPLNLQVSSAVFYQNAIILYENTGRVIKFDTAGNQLWAVQSPIILKNLKPAFDGIIGCGATKNSKGGVIKINFDGSISNVLETEDDREYYDIVVSSDGRYAVTGVSTSGDFTLTKMDMSGTVEWKRTYGKGYGAAILEDPYGGYVVAGKLQDTLLVIRTDTSGIAPLPVDAVYRERIIATENIQATLLPKATWFNNAGRGTLLSLINGGAATVAGFAPWIAALDDSAALHLSVDLFSPETKRDFRMGFAKNVSSDFERLWRVAGADIERLQLDFGLDQKIDGPVPYDILTWPARGNQNWKYNLDFSPVTSNPKFFAAPFVDTNHDGIYDVFDGDYPLIKGDQMVWMAITDSSNHTGTAAPAVGVDIGVSAYSFDCPQSSLLPNTLFVDYTVISRFNAALYDAYVGFFTDFDLGCSYDDYIGSIPECHSFLGYNQSPSDDHCGPDFPFFANDIPAQSITFLSPSLDHSMYCVYFDGNPQMLYPSTPKDYYGYMQNFWLDGTPLTSGGIGYNPGHTEKVNFVFPGNPADSSGWSMCWSFPSIAEQWMINTHGPFDFYPNDTIQFALAFILHPDVQYPCPDLNQHIKPDILQIRQWFADSWLQSRPTLPPVLNLANGQEITLNASVPAGQYSWSTGATDPIIHVSVPGTYTVSITDGMGCETHKTVLVRMLSGLSQPDINHVWKVWPNPAANWLNISGPEKYSNQFVLRIFEMNGQLVSEHTASGPFSPIYIGQLTNGIYWLELLEEQRSWGVRKLTIMNK